MNPEFSNLESLPLSLLNDYLYCPRRAALKLLEGWREANEHTARGDIAHEHADLPGYEVAKGALLWRALPVWSERLGLNGKCDLVEVTPRPPGARLQADPCPAPNPKSEILNPKSLLPVEFKLGKRRKWENDDAQVCAQALCLEEMFGLEVPRGAIFHADSKRRREVEFTLELRRLTEDAIRQLHALLGDPPAGAEEEEAGDRKLEAGAASPRSAMAALPPAVHRPACAECSLYEICLPQVTSQPPRLDRVARALFQV